MPSLNDQLNLLKLSMQPSLLFLSFSIIAFVPTKVFAEVKSYQEHMPMPSIDLTFPHELKEFNKQLGILEKIIGKRMDDQKAKDEIEINDKI